MTLRAIAVAIAASAITAIPASAEVYDFTPAIKVNFEIKGAITAKGSTGANVLGTSCAVWAAGRPDVNPKPTIEFITTFDDVNGQPFYLETVTRDYPGPGTYDGRVLPLRIWTGGKSWERWGSDAADLAKTKFTIAADGSGSMAFEGYTSDRSGEAPYPEISGTMSWTCVNPKG